jgi:hypothetical protein
MNILITLLIVFFIITIALTLHTSSSNKQIPNSPSSVDKMTMLNEAFISFLGPKWAYVLLAFTILLAISLFFLYTSISKSNGLINVTLNDTNLQRLTLVFTYFTIIFAIFVIVLSYKQYKSYVNQQTYGSNNNYAPTSEEKTQQQELITVVGLLLFILIAGGYSVWYFFFKKH